MIDVLEFVNGIMAILTILVLIYIGIEVVLLTRKHDE